MLTTYKDNLHFKCGAIKSNFDPLDSSDSNLDLFTSDSNMNKELCYKKKGHLWLKEKVLMHKPYEVEKYNAKSDVRIFYKFI